MDDRTLVLDIARAFLDLFLHHTPRNIPHLFVTPMLFRHF